MSAQDADRQLTAPEGWTGRLRSFLVGTGFAAAFLLARAVLGYFFPDLVPFALTFPAALIATLLAGRVAGVVCVLFSQPLAFLLFLPAATRAHIDAASLVLATLSGFVIVGFAGSYRSMGRRLLAGRRLEADARLSALEEERRRLMVMLDGAPAVITLLQGPEHRVTLSNAAHRRLIGASDVIGRPIREIEPDLREQGLLQIYDEVFATGQPRSGEDYPVRYRRAEGVEERRFDFIVQPVLGADARTEGVFTLSIDVTERANALLELRDSEARFRAAVDAVEGVLWTNTAAGEMRGEQPGWARLTGQSIEEYQGYGWADAIDPEDRIPTISAWNAAVATGKTFVFEHRLRRADGTLRTFAVRGVPLLGPQGEIRQWVGVHTDVTEQRRNEVALRDLNSALNQRVEEAVAERNLFADLVETTHALVFVVDLDLRIIALNRAASLHVREVYGHRIGVGDEVTGILMDHPGQPEAARRLWERALAGEEFTVLSDFGAPGDVRTYEIRFNVLRDASGARIGAYQFVSDVTQRISEQRRLASAEEQLTQSLKMEAMGQLTGGVAHDFNNLLTPIVGALDALQRRGVGAEREQRLISGALQSAERAATLVQRLLAFARRQPLTTRAVDVAALVDGLAELIDSTIGPQIDVVIDVSADTPLAEADANQLETALLNLVLNARDAISGSGTVRITADRAEVGPDGAPGAEGNLKPGAYVRIAVEDTGTGMDPEILGRIIEPFFTTKAPGKGTGLGLSMVHGLARQLGGGLQITSALGSGTRVSLLIPAATRQALPRSDAFAPPQAPASSDPVLLVDDEDLVRAATASMLSDLGYGVREAASGEEALALVTAGLRPSLLVTDHKMPGMTGAQLARELRTLFPALPALLISGYADEEPLAEDLPLLPKPFRRADLARSLSALGPAEGRALPVGSVGVGGAA